MRMSNGNGPFPFPGGTNSVTSARRRKAGEYSVSNETPGWPGTGAETTLRISPLRTAPFRLAQLLTRLARRVLPTHTGMLLGWHDRAHRTREVDLQICRKRRHVEGIANVGEHQVAVLKFRMFLCRVAKRVLVIARRRHLHLRSLVNDLPLAPWAD